MTAWMLAARFSASSTSWRALGGFSFAPVLAEAWTSSLAIPSSHSGSRSAIAYEQQSTTLRPIIHRPMSSTGNPSLQSSRLSVLRGGAALWQTPSSDAVNGAGNSDNENSNQEQRIPRTGWNHNEPDADGDFWMDPQTAAERTTEKDFVKDDTGRQKFRTGWLHGGSSSNDETTTSSQSSTTNNKKNTPPRNLARERLNQAMLESTRNHRIIAPVTFHTTSVQEQLAVTEHLLSVPLSHADSEDSNNKDRIDVFFTIVEKVDSEEKRTWMKQHLSLAANPRQRASAYVQQAALKDATGMCLYLQGGPGYGAPSPVAGLGLGSAASSWAAQALYTCGYERIVLMDQRGTGRSSPLTKQTLERMFPDVFALDGVAADSLDKVSEQDHAEDVSKVQSAIQSATDHLAKFRADGIVRDAELIKDALMKPKEIGGEEDEKDEDGGESKKVPNPWGAALGQSFGGFCLMTYLSQIEHPPRICLFTGGIAPILAPSLYDVYAKLWRGVQKRSQLYYEMYPGDVAQVKRIVQRLLMQPEKLPGGGILSARRFLQVGLNFLGSSPSAFASMHSLLSSAFVNDGADVSDLQFQRSFLKTMDHKQGFDESPIYFWMHESIYANAEHNSPTQWAAHRAYEDLAKEDPSVWDYRLTSKNIDDDDSKTLFFGEMVFPWMANGEFAEVSGIGMKGLAEALASKDDWPALFDTTKMKDALDSGKSRAAAAVYYDDFYVDFDFSMQVLDGPMAKCKPYITNEYQHSGLRDDGANIFLKLHGMANGQTRIPS